MADPTPEEIAEDLTPAMRAVICDLSEWSYAHSRTQVALRIRGLLCWPECADGYGRPSLTDLGLEVREALARKEGR